MVLPLSIICLVALVYDLYLTAWALFSVIYCLYFEFKVALQRYNNIHNLKKDLSQQCF